MTAFQNCPDKQTNERTNHQWNGSSFNHSVNTQPRYKLVERHFLFLFIDCHIFGDGCFYTVLD